MWVKVERLLDRNFYNLIYGRLEQWFANYDPQSLRFPIKKNSWCPKRRFFRAVMLCILQKMLLNATNAPQNCQSDVWCFMALKNTKLK